VVRIHPFLASLVEGGKWSASDQSSFAPEESVSDIYWGGWAQSKSG